MSTSGSAVAFLGECVVCGAFEQRRWIHHYGVQNVCISCGIFFGRNYARKFSCNSLHQCKLFQNATNLTGRDRAIAKKACRACRLKKCFQMGMRQEMPKHAKAIKNEEPNISALVPLADNKTAVANQTIASLTAFERQMVQFHAQDRVFAPGFLEQFDSLKKLLQFGPNILANFHTVTFPLTPLPMAIEREEFICGKRGTGMEIVKMQLISAMELVRSMPIFSRIDKRDAACLINYIAFPMYVFNGGHYASQLNSSIWVRPSGFSDYLCCANRPDPVFREAIERVYRKTMVKFNELRMSLEEFLLLRTVIILHSATTGLSSHGRDLIQAEAEKHADILMQYLRSCHGDFGGAKRYADLLSLAESVFHTAERHHEIAHYAAVTNEMARTALKTIIPPVLGPMFWHGRDFDMV